MFDPFRIRRSTPIAKPRLRLIENNNQLPPTLTRIMRGVAYYENGALIRRYDVVRVGRKSHLEKINVAA